MFDPPAAGVLPDDVLATGVADDVPAPDVLGVEVAGEELDEHPTIRAAVAAAATAPAAMRARSNIDMVVCRSFQEKGTPADPR